MESVGQLCISLGDLSPGSGRPVCWVGMGGKVGGNIMVVVGDNVGACTAGARLRGWRNGTEVGSFPSWLEMLGSCLGRTAGGGWWGSQQSWGDRARLSEKWGAYGSTGIVDAGV